MRASSAVVACALMLSGSVAAVVSATVDAAVTATLANPATPTTPPATRVGPAGVPSLRVTGRMSFPANALARSAHGGFSLSERGVDWPGSAGTMTLTVRRPLDDPGNSVRVSLFYQTTDPNEEGTVVFSVTPVSFNNGSGFETYGGFSTAPRQATGDITGLRSSTVTIPRVNGLGGGAWWFFEIHRAEGYTGSLRLMSVPIDY